MNRIILNTINSTKVSIPAKILVFDMAGTTINENGIVYKTLYNTIKDYGLEINENELTKWHGANKYDVLNHFLEKKKYSVTTTSNLPIEYGILNNRDKIKRELKQQLYTNFNNNLKEVYLDPNLDPSIKLMDENMPILFNKIRSKGIKIALNTGYNKDIQQILIDKFNMTEFIDDYISSEEVYSGRPHSYMINKLIERNNIYFSNNVYSSNDVIKFGDSVNDILEGHNARCIASVGVLSGADNKETLNTANPTHLIKSVMDIDVE